MKRKFISQLVNFIKSNKVICLVILLLILVGVVIVIFPFLEKNFSCLAEYYFGGEKSPKGELLKIILQIFGGIFLIIGAWATLRRVRIMEQNSVAEKFRNSIEQLESNKTSIVIGSLHSLNHIAKTNSDYVQQIIGIFESHIRDRMDKEKDWKSLTWQEKKRYRLPTEVQTILDILFRNKNSKIYQKTIIDLNRCKLHRANLNYANLKNAYLNKTKLQGAFLSYADMSNIDMEGADLSSAQLIGTNLINSKISNSYFIGADMKATKLQFAKLRNSHFENAYISSAHFERAFLHKASFIGCDSIDTNFISADLGRADFSGSRLIRQDFRFATLSETKFYGAFIKESTFKDSELLYTRFNGACSKLNSGRDELEYSFYSTLNQRGNKETEFDKSVSFGNVTDEEKQVIINNFKKKIENKKLVSKFIKSINNSLFQDTDESVKGTLSKEIAENIVNQFDKAIRFAGIVLK